MKQKPEIPWSPSARTSWPVQRAKTLLYRQKNLNADRKEQQILSLTLRGVVPNDPENPEGLVPEDYATYQIFEPDDLVFKLIDLENERTSRVGLVDQRGIMSSAYVRLRSRTGTCVRFLYWAFFDLYNRRVFNFLGSGVRSTLSAEDVLNLPMLVPPINEQQAIADYLDAETARIDALIEKKKRMVELLGERRRPSIQAAVDSITPQSMVPLRHLLREVDIRGETDREVLSVYRDIGVVPKSSRDDNFNKTPENLDNYKSVEVGNVVMNKMKAWQGSVAVSEHSGIVSGDYLVCRWTGPWVLPNYVHHVLRSPRMIEEYRIRSSGIRPSQWRLYWEDFAQIQFPLCTPADQQRLVEDLDNLTASDNHLIERLNSQVALLLEKRQTLITAAVTGELEIPGVAA